MFNVKPLLSPTRVLRTLPSATSVSIYVTAYAGDATSPVATSAAPAAIAMPPRVMFLAMFLFLSWFTRGVLPQAVKISHHQPSRRW